MQDWRVHWLEAERDLTAWQAPLQAGIDIARQAVSQLVPSGRLDILIQPGDFVIREIGMAGYAYGKSLFSLTVDPDNPNFAGALEDGALPRQIAHEVHHCLRMAGPGYGRTLGEALVTEGLAGQFVRKLFGNTPEPWESAVEDALLAQHFPTDEELAAASYDHDAWFFGAGGTYPPCLGYTLGYRLVGAWLEQAEPVDVATWINVPAEMVLSKGKESFLRAIRRVEGLET